MHWTAHAYGRAAYTVYTYTHGYGNDAYGGTTGGAGPNVALLLEVGMLAAAASSKLVWIAKRYLKVGGLWPPQTHSMYNSARPKKRFIYNYGIR